MNTKSEHSLARDRLNLVISSLAQRDADELAAICEELGIKGLTCTTTECPLARLFNLELEPLGCYAVVDGVAAFIYKTQDSMRIALSLPQPMAKFVSQFDRRFYPSLVESLIVSHSEKGS